MKIQGFEGTIAAIERDLLLTALGLMLVVVVPIILLTLTFAWRYRASNTQGKFTPDWDRSTLIDVITWGVPAILIAGLGTLVWKSTHRLDPYRPIPSEVAATRVQAIAYDWKWLFIYPDLGLATVNELAFPLDRPLALQITSEVAMNSFMIPGLGGQIYAMAGMETKLHLWADKEGTYPGRNMQYSGDGFSNQSFDALALSAADYENWVEKVRNAPMVLAGKAYEDLKKPSVSNPVLYYSDVTPNLFRSIVQTYAHSHDAMNGMTN